MRCYEIAGNKARAREVEALQKEKGKKQVDEMLRDDERKKKFKKEQKELEKELGI
jgi:hypothetical protein